MLKTFLLRSVGINTQKQQHEVRGLVRCLANYNLRDSLSPFHHHFTIRLLEWFPVPLSASVFLQINHSKQRSVLKEATFQNNLLKPKCNSCLEFNLQC